MFIALIWAEVGQRTLGCWPFRTLFRRATLSFFLKRNKKIKFEKGEPDRKKSKNGCLPPADRVGGVGPGTSRPSSGREVPKIFRGPSRGALRE
jgi:hypothetical protein